jgi:putative ABC transport system permease protein
VGILILVVLLGTGQGFQNSVMDLFSAFAQKSVYVYGGSTSMKYENIKEGKKIKNPIQRSIQKIKKQNTSTKDINI